ncbi:MAG: thioredoxin domain-containing protein [Polyangiaceae bacterium]
MVLSIGQQALGFTVSRRLSSAGAPLAIGTRGSELGLLVELPQTLAGAKLSVRSEDWLRRARHATLGSPALVGPSALGEEGDSGVAVYPLSGRLVVESPAPITADELRRAFTPVVESVATLHDQGLLHGALRSEFLVRDGDRFGLLGVGLESLARELGGPRLVRDLVPTDFRPPELRGQNPPIAAEWGDAYALAVMLAELLAGRAASGEEPITPRALGAAVPDALEQYLLPAVSARISDRPRDLRAWWTRVLEILETEISLPAPETATAPQALQPTTAEALDAPQSSSAPGSTQLLEPSAGSDQAPRREPMDLTAQPGGFTPPPGTALPVAPPWAADGQRFEPPHIPGKLPLRPPVPPGPTVPAAVAFPRGSAVPAPTAVPAAAKVPPPAELPPPSWLAPKPKAAFAAGATQAAPTSPASPGVFQVEGFTPPPGVVEGEPIAVDQEPERLGRPGMPTFAKQATPGMEPAPAKHNSLGFNVAAGKLVPRQTEPIDTVVDDATRVSPLAASWERPPPSASAFKELGSAEPAADQPASGPSVEAPELPASSATVEAPVGATKPERTLEKPPAGPPVPDKFIHADTKPKEPAGEGRRSLFVGVAITSAAVLVVATLGVIFAMRLSSRGSTATAPSATVAPATPDAGVAAAPTAPATSTPPTSAPSPADAGVAPPSFAKGASSGEFGLAGHRDESALLPLPSHAPVWGEATAPVTLVVFGDLECKHTRRLFSVLDTLKSDFGKDLRLAWVHTPLTVHPGALRASQSMAALTRQYGSSAFWRILEEWAHSPDAPNDASLVRWGSDAGIRVDATKLTGDSVAEKQVADDRALGIRFGVRSTPTLYLNGALIEGFHSRGELHRAIQSELSATRSLVAAGVDPSSVYATRVKKNLIDVGEAIPERVCPALLDAPVLGKSDALVTIVEFSDFECAYCEKVQPTLKQLRTRYGDDLRLVWKHLPLGVHERARPAATLAIEAQKQLGDAGFWKVHDALFANQADLSDAALLKIATDAGLPGTVMEAVRGDTRRPRIEADIREADRVGAKGTPTFYVNGRLLEGAQPLAKFDELVSAELKVARRLVSGGTPRQEVYDTVCGRP